MPLGLLMLVGKFLFLALLYLFLTWAFRGLFRQMGLESQSGAPARVSAAAAPAPLARAVAPAPQAAAPLAGPSVPAPAPHPRARLVVADGGQSGLTTGQIVDLPAALTIGRAEDNGLPVQDRFCSSHHALIFLHEGQRLLRDRQSTNGVFHNGQRVTADVVLSDGDRINLGTLALIYRASAAE